MLIISTTFHHQAQCAIAVASAIRRYGREAGIAYCIKNGVTAPTRLVTIARQLEALRRDEARTGEDWR